MIHPTEENNPHLFLDESEKASLLFDALTEHEETQNLAVF